MTDNDGQRRGYLRHQVAMGGKMPRKPPRLYPEHDPVHRFALRLRELHRAAGKPTRVQLARQMHCSASTVTHILNGDRFPSWTQVVALAEACGAPTEPLHEVWMRADADNESAQRPTHYQPLGISLPILPLYVVCDVSLSLAPQVPALNEALLRLSCTLRDSRRLSSMTRVCVIAFGDKAQVVTPLSDFTDPATITPLQPQGGCAYGPALALLRRTIQQDLTALKAEGHQVYRPVVFFLTDGEPRDMMSWEPEHDALTAVDWTYHPHILAFGLGISHPSTIRKVATLGAYRADHAASAVDALTEFVTSVLKSFETKVPYSGTPEFAREIFSVINDIDAI
ncbi:helix-turn-helix domain-containing protein [Streptomyces sp. BE20]|uniref:helix-turn-helix domain-containing protein n=1 Tax=Streptomyces sp. BE20 TaxID=3002525 RepID=UPI002E76F80C|nr:helix-turn-helix domain-containing protein [Streptomyces sp. BE20]MEE1821595.1 helix-turn-helix domain-containing protein [Streptomyces sp. BE20]